MNIQKREKHKNTAVSKQRSRQGEENSTLIKITKGALISLLITFIISFVLLLVGTAVAYSTADPNSLIKPVSIVSLYISAFFGGFVCRKLNKTSTLLTTALTSALFVLLGLAISFALPDSPVESGFSSWITLILRLASIGMFFVGSALGKDKPKPRKRLKRK